MFKYVLVGWLKNCLNHYLQYIYIVIIAIILYAALLHFFLKVCF
jgi:hypothetical protein